MPFHPRLKLGLSSFDLLALRGRCADIDAGGHCKVEYTLNCNVSTKDESIGITGGYETTGFSRSQSPANPQPAGFRAPCKIGHQIPVKRRARALYSNLHKSKIYAQAETFSSCIMLTAKALEITFSLSAPIVEKHPLLLTRVEPTNYQLSSSDGSPCFWDALPPRHTKLRFNLRYVSAQFFKVLVHPDSATDGKNRKHNRNRPHHQVIVVVRDEPSPNDATAMMV